MKSMEQKYSQVDAQEHYLTWCYLKSRYYLNFKINHVNQLMGHLGNQDSQSKALIKKHGAIVRHAQQMLPYKGQQNQKD